MKLCNYFNNAHILIFRDFLKSDPSHSTILKISSENEFYRPYISLEPKIMFYDFPTVIYKRIFILTARWDGLVMNEYNHQDIACEVKF